MGFQLLQNAISNIGNILQGSVKLNRMTVEQRSSCLRILQGVPSLDKVRDVDLVSKKNRATFDSL